MKSATLSSLALFFLSAWLATGCAGPSLPATTFQTAAPTATSLATDTSVPDVTPTESTATSITLTGTIEPISTIVITALPPVQISPVGTSIPIILPTATPTPFAAPTGISPTVIKYQLISQFGEPFYCDPDEYPVAHEVSQQEVDQRVAALQQQDPDEYQVILQHLGLAGTPNLSPEQRQLVYAEAKKLNGILVQPSGSGYEFNIRIASSGSRQGTAISGTVSPGGAITVSQRQPTFLTCPICLALNTMLDTPNGAVRVQDIKPGMRVWSLDANGERYAANVVKTISRPVPEDFRIVQLRLADGRIVLASPNHPTVDGRTIGELTAGDILDGVRVASVTLVPYTNASTYDILPSGPTGAYWANGILLKSTLMP
jgi:hypothetical protein